MLLTTLGSAVDTETENTNVKIYKIYLMMFGKYDTYAQLFELFSHDFFVGKKKIFFIPNSSH